MSFRQEDRICRKGTGRGVKKKLKPETGEEGASNW